MVDQPPGHQRSKTPAAQLPELREGLPELAAVVGRYPREGQ